VGFLNGKIYNGAFAGAQAWNQIKTEKVDLGGGLKKGNSVLQVYKRSARAPSHAARIAFPLCANYLICAVPNLQCYTSISLLGHDIPSFLPSFLPAFLPSWPLLLKTESKKKIPKKINLPFLMSMSRTTSIQPARIFSMTSSHVIMIDAAPMPHSSSFC
jgi:hypothetical protein